MAKYRFERDPESQAAIWIKETAPDIGGLLRLKAAAPIKPVKPQKACDDGLFSDTANQKEFKL